MTHELNSLNRHWSDLNKEKIPIGILVSSIFSGLFFNPLNIILTYKRLDYEKYSYREIAKIIKIKYGYRGFYRRLPIACAGGFFLDEVFILSLEYNRENLNFETQFSRDFIVGFLLHAIITPFYTSYHLLCNKQMGAGMKSTNPYQNLYQISKSIIKKD